MPVYRSARTGRSNRAAYIRDRTAEVRDRARDTRRDAARARVEAVAGVVDSARAFLDQFTDVEPFSRNENWGGVVRDFPSVLADAADAALSRARELPRRMVRTFYGEDEPVTVTGEPVFESTAKTTTARRTTVRARHPEQHVVNEIERYFDRIPASGAKLQSVVDHVVMRTGYDEGTVSSIIRRHFVHNNTIVTRNQNVEVTASIDPVIDWMRRVLTDHGYTDQREDVELTALPDIAETAALVAFEGGRPAVLCYPCDYGDVNDTALREAAMFEASAIAPGQEAQIVWVSDGTSSYIYDTHSQTVLSDIPQAGESVVIGTTRGATTKPPRTTPTRTNTNI